MKSELGDEFFAENSFNITRHFTRRYRPVDKKASRMDGKLSEIRHEFSLDEELAWQETRLDELFFFWCENSYSLRVWKGGGGDPVHSSRELKIKWKLK